VPVDPRQGLTAFAGNDPTQSTCTIGVGLSHASRHLYGLTLTAADSHKLRER
jgi:hypothetical protein